MMAIRTRYYSATNHRGSRIVASVSDGSKVVKVSVPYPHELTGNDCHAYAAYKLLEFLGWDYDIVSSGTYANDEYFTMARKGIVPEFIIAALLT